MVDIICLIPAYRPEPEDLKKSIHSMLDQSIAVDVCLIDDGSPTAVELDERSAGKVKVIRLAENVGITGALKKGVEYALQQNYQFICRLDVGDISYRNRASQQLDFMRANPDVSIVGGLSRVISKNGNTLFIHGRPGIGKSVHRRIYHNAAFKHSTFFIRAQYIREYGTYDEAYCGAEDYEIVLRYAGRTRIAVIDELVIDYVDDPAGISNSRRKKQISMRLSAQLRYFNIRSMSSLTGIIRTIITACLPLNLAKKCSAAMSYLAKDR